MTDLLEYLGLEVTFPEHFLHYFLRRDGRGLIRHRIFCEITYSPENIVAIVSDRKRTQDIDSHTLYNGPDLVLL